MTTLADAWRWYTSVSLQAKLAGRLADAHWASLPWDGPLGRDALVSPLEPTRVAADAKFVADEIADLAVMLLFSVFEATVRQAILTEVEEEARNLKNVTLRHAARDALDAIAEGSFFRVLEPFKSGGNADLVEEVNQVRRYRNWVAHGRRGDSPNAVTPAAAFDRLKRFLAVILPPAP